LFDELYRLRTLNENSDLTLDASNKTVYGGDPYVFGIDPVCSLISNCHSCFLFFAVTALDRSCRVAGCIYIL